MPYVTLSGIAVHGQCLLLQTRARLRCRDRLLAAIAGTTRCQYRREAHAAWAHYRVFASRLDCTLLSLHPALWAQRKGFETAFLFQRQRLEVTLCGTRRGAGPVPTEMVHFVEEETRRVQGGAFMFVPDLAMFTQNPANALMALRVEDAIGGGTEEGENDALTSGASLLGRTAWTPRFL